MKWTHAFHWPRARGYLAASLAAAALSGCTVKTGLRPDDLPRVLAVAEQDPERPVMSAGEGATPVETRGPVIAVVVTMSGPQKERNRFEAPVRARFDETSLTVWNRGTMRSYTSLEVGRIVVQRYDSSGAVKAGIWLTAIGVAMTAGGALLFAQATHSNDGLPFLGIPIMSAGVGLGAGGIPLLVAGTRTPAPMVVAGPGGLRIRF